MPVSRPPVPRQGKQAGFFIYDHIRRINLHDRVGSGITPAALSHHRTCGSAYGGS